MLISDPDQKYNICHFSLFDFWTDSFWTKYFYYENIVFSRHNNILVILCLLTVHMNL